MDITLKPLQAKESMPLWLWMVDPIFAILFMIELLARFHMQGFNFFRRPNVQWNLFESAVVLMMLLEFVFNTYNAVFVRVIRVLRFLRAFRIIKTVSYVRQLRILFLALYNSVLSLFWVVMVVVVIVWLCSTCLMQTVELYIDSHGVDVVDPRVFVRYGSLGASMLSLFQAISGGVPWEQLVAPLATLSGLYYPAWMAYIMVVVFGVLNLVTALFVESVRNTADMDLEAEMMEQMRRPDSTMSKIRVMLRGSTAIPADDITEDDLAAEITPKGRELVPDQVKKELLQRIRLFLASTGGAASNTA